MRLYDEKRSYHSAMEAYEVASTAESACELEQAWVAVHLNVQERVGEGNGVRHPVHTLANLHLIPHQRTRSMFFFLFAVYMKILQLALFWR